MYFDCTLSGTEWFCDAFIHPYSAEGVIIKSSYKHSRSINHNVEGVFNLHERNINIINRNLNFSTIFFFFFTAYTFILATAEIDT